MFATFRRLSAGYYSLSGQSAQVANDNPPPPTNSNSTNNNDKVPIDDDEVSNLLSIFREKLFKGVPNFDDNDEYYFGLMKRLTLETAQKGDKITTKGRMGRKLYIIQSGEVNVMSDDEQFIKITLGKGTLFGEQSLIYDAPRNATVMVASDEVTLYSLRQSDFKEYQKSQAIQADNNRLNLLSASSDLNTKLSKDQRRMLVGKMHLKHSQYGSVLYERGDPLDLNMYRDIILIESGTAVVYYKIKFENKTPDQIDEELGIVRNKKYGSESAVVDATKVENVRNSARIKRASIASITLSLNSKKQLQGGVGGGDKLTSPINSKGKGASPLNSTSPAHEEKVGGWGLLLANRNKITHMEPNTCTEVDISPDPKYVDFKRASVVNPHMEETVDVEKVHKYDAEMGYFACVVGKGCILGMPVLRGHSLKKAHPAWVLSDNDEAATTEVTVQVMSHKMVYSTFSVDTFERLFGKHPLAHDKVPEPKLGGGSLSGFARQFDIAEFNPKHQWDLLGGGREGSLGFVMGVRLTAAGQRANALVAEGAGAKAASTRASVNPQAARRSSFMDFLQSLAPRPGKRTSNVPANKPPPPPAAKPKTKAPAPKSTSAKAAPTKGAVTKGAATKGTATKGAATKGGPVKGKPAAGKKTVTTAAKPTQSTAPVKAATSPSSAVTEPAKSSVPVPVPVPVPAEDVKAVDSTKSPTDIPSASPATQSTTETASNPDKPTETTVPPASSPGTEASKPAGLPIPPPPPIQTSQITEPLQPPAPPSAGKIAGAHNSIQTRTSVSGGLDNYSFALKVYNKLALIRHGKPNKPQELMRCMKILKELSESVNEHTGKICIVEFHGVMATKSQICYALEPLLYGSLRRVLKWMSDPSSEVYKKKRHSGLEERLIAEMHKLEHRQDSTGSTAANKHADLKIKLIRFYGGCLARAIDYMRSYGVAHRDIRPENVYFDEDGYPKLVDFSECKRFPYHDFKEDKQLVKAYTLVGVADYQAPEFFDKSKGHDTGVDQWALGILLYELFMGNQCTPFRYSRKACDFDPRKIELAISDIQKRIVATALDGVRLPFPEKFQETTLGMTLLNLIERLLIVEPEKRYPFCSNDKQHLNILDHQFFDDEMVNDANMWKRERLMSGDYTPNFSPPRFKREIHPHFDPQELFVKFLGDQSHFIGFR